MGEYKIHRGYIIIIILVSFIQFSNTLGHSFAWDDKIVITENERVQSGFSGITQIFRKHDTDLRQDQYGYRPITLLTFAFDYQLSGGKPSFFHFMNLVYFTLLCFVLFLFVRRLFYNYSILVPFLITLLFSVHPIHVEVVANIKSRDEILALLFCLISMIQLIKFYQLGKWKYLFLTILFFLFGFLSKENAVVFLLLYPLTLFRYSNTNWKPALKITAIILPIVTLLVFLISSYALNSEVGMERTAGLGIYQENFILGNAFFYEDLFINKIGNAFYLILLYFKDFFVPINLAYYHGLGDIESVGIGWQSIFGAIATIFLLILAILRFKKKPIISYGILFFFFSISIYLHIVKTLADTRADRFLFFASIGLSIMLIGILLRIFKADLKKSEIESQQSPLQLFSKLPIGFKGVFIALLLIFSSITFSRNSIWKNDFTLVENDMERLENSARPHYFFATNLLQDIQLNGYNSVKEKKMIHHYRRSFEISDSIYYGRIEFGNYLSQQGRASEAMKIFQEMVDLFPNTSDPQFYLGQSLVKSEEYELAIPYLEKSITIAPKSPDSYYLLAISYAKIGAYRKAEDLAKSGLKKFPNAAQSMYEALGHIYFEMDNLPKSTSSTLKMIEYGSDPYTTYATVIGRYQQKGDHENAGNYYRVAIEKGIMRPQ